jgi:hypothetical protein
MREANRAASLGEAIAALLRRVPDLWEPVPDGDPEALARLTAAGFIERRVTFTIKLPGDDKPQRITIELTGEYGLVEALTGVVQDLWARCGERWRELRAETGEPIKPIVSLERDEWRMTDQGRSARDDLERDATVPIDFALKRGFFNSREPVRGQGRLVRIENAASGPLAVDLAKCSAAPEIAQAFAAAFAEIPKAKQATEAVGNKAEEPADPVPAVATEPPPKRSTGGSEGGKPRADTGTDRPRRDPNQPSRDRQDDILAAIRDAKMPLTRSELIDAMKLKTEGKLGANLAWMVANGILINIPQRGYWPAGDPVPV